MAVTGKNTLTLRKRDLENEKTISVGFSKLQAWHKADAGETGIDLLALNFPTEITGTTNPSISKLSGAQMRKYAMNVTVRSSLRGVLMRELSYTIPSGTRINFKDFTADQDEIFEITIDHEASTELTVVDGKNLVATGELIIGDTDFNVGEPFDINKYPTEQIGTVLVYRNGLLQFRNPGNTTSGGNYQEVDPGGGTGIIIRFNNAAAGSDDNIHVVSNGVVAERPVVSQQADIENTQGQIDAMVPTLAALAGVPETDFQTAPNNIDLKAFGDRVLDNENDISALQISKQDVFTVPYEIHTLPSDISVTTVDVAPLRFNNLEIGKTYRVTMQATITAGTNTGSLKALNNGVVILHITDQPDGGGPSDRFSIGDSVIFIASATTVTFNFAENTVAILEGDGTTSETFVMLEELPNHIVTTQWT